MRFWNSLLLAASLLACSNPSADRPEAAKTVMLEVEGMHCGGCAASIEASLLDVPGVVSAAVDVATHRATVGVSAAGPADGALVAAVEAAGYRARPMVAPSTPDS